MNQCDFLVQGSVLCGRTPTRRVTMDNDETLFVCEHHYQTLNKDLIRHEMVLADAD